MRHGYTVKSNGSCVEIAKSKYSGVILSSNIPYLRAVRDTKQTSIINISRHNIQEIIKRRWYCANFINDVNQCICIDGIRRPYKVKSRDLRSLNKIFIIEYDVSTVIKIIPTMIYSCLDLDHYANLIKVSQALNKGQCHIFIMLTLISKHKIYEMTKT